ncbi:MAG: DUF6323 family protein [Coprobacillus sp.]
MFDLSLFDNERKKVEAVNKVMVCNNISSRYGMILKQEDVLRIIETQELSLVEQERIEFGGTIIEQLIYAFCDSQFISKYEYAESMIKFVEIFYHYREELDEFLSDEEIIEYMQRSFNGPCQGSMDWLESSQLWILMKAIDERKDIYMDDDYGCF